MTGENIIIGWLSIFRTFGDAVLTVRVFSRPKADQRTLAVDVQNRDGRPKLIRRSPVYILIAPNEEREPSSILATSVSDIIRKPRNVERSIKTHDRNTALVSNGEKLFQKLVA